MSSQKEAGKIATAGAASGHWRTVLIFAVALGLAMAVFALRSAQNVEFVYGGL
jgi:hypothetical protein